MSNRAAVFQKRRKSCKRTRTNAGHFLFYILYSSLEIPPSLGLEPLGRRSAHETHPVWEGGGRASAERRRRRSRCEVAVRLQPKGSSSRKPPSAEKPVEITLRKTRDEANWRRKTLGHRDDREQDRQETKARLMDKYKDGTNKTFFFYDSPVCLLK